MPPRRSSRGVSSPSAFPHHRAAALSRVRASTPSPFAPSGFLDLMTLFSAPVICWPCFMPDPLLGFHPPKPFSSGAAVRRLRRPCPLVVVTPLPAALPPLGHPLSRLPLVLFATLRSAPRLQGLAPHQKLPHRAGCLGRTRALSSPGLLHPPGFSPSPTRPGLHRASPHELRRFIGRKRPAPPWAPQGLHAEEIGSSLAGPPTLLGFFAPSDHPHGFRATADSGVASSDCEVCHHPLTNPL